ncbi:MAG: PEP-CTERM sorting domain-containing protein [Phycisphaeraceae bacterium]
MKRFTRMSFLAAGLAVALTATSAQAILISATSTVTGNDRVLNTVTTTQGTFTQEQMINIEVTHYRGTSTTWAIRGDGGAVPAAGNRAALLEDFSLSTGLPNPGGSAVNGITSPAVINASPATGNTQGLAFNFLTPVENGNGVDVIFWEIGTSDGQATDPFALSLLDGSAQKAYTAADFTLVLAGLNLRTATGTAPNSLAELESNALANGALGNFSFRGIGIDLSDLGIAPGATVTGLFLTGGAIDPVLIVGLIQVPEPATLSLLALSAGALVRRSRRRVA